MEKQPESYPLASASWFSLGIAVSLFLAVALVIGYPVFLYTWCRIEVPNRHLAILVKKTGKNLSNDDEMAPGPEYKGLQPDVLAEGRHYRNPWSWDWEVVPQVEIPQDKLGVRIRLYGEDLPYGELIAWQEGQKGIVPEVLRPGRHPLNAWLVGEGTRRRNNYAEYIELHDPIVVPAGYKGVVTRLSGPMPDNPNVLLVPKGFRGVQEEAETLDPGTYYFNSYVNRVDLVDCRSKRFDLTTGGEMGFPSKDGFWVTLDGTIEFRVLPDRAAHVFVTYNDEKNDSEARAAIEEEIINKIILPNARSFCRLRGSDNSGKEFISGDTRTKFQQDFQDEMSRTCESQGIQIIQALITRIHPPQRIAEPVRARQIAAQQEKQFAKQILQQESEKQLAIEQELIKRKQALIEAERSVVQRVTEETQAQEVALIQARQQLNVAELELQAAADLAVAVAERGRAAAEVIQFNNQAEAAGWQKSVAAFDNDGNAFARWVMYKKISPAYRRMMVNTADSPIMDIFRQFTENTASESHPASVDPDAIKIMTSRPDAATDSDETSQPQAEIAPAEIAP